MAQEDEKPWRFNIIKGSRQKAQHRINHKIQEPEIRLIDQDGEQRGVMSVDEAIKIAESVSLDLVEIAPNSEPPVCRIMDYGRFKFDLSKKAQLSKKNQKQAQIKEIKFRPATEEGDYQVKLRNLSRFIAEGDKAKVTLRFRGREFAHQQLGLKLLQRVEEDLSSIAVVEQHPKLEGRQMVMMLSPKKKGT